MAAEKKSGEGPITIKKYANRRLYNTATSSYVTLDDLCQMVKTGQEFVVFDAKTGEDITRSVLTQIIVEEEAKGGQNLLPIGFLRQLISFYGDSLQGLVPRYLEQSMATFARNQEQMRKYLQNAFDGIFPFGSLEEMGKQNVALFEQAMKMFTPFAEEVMGKAADGGAAPGGAAKPAAEGAAGASADQKLDELRQRIEDLQQQLEAISDKKAPAKK